MLLTYYSTAARDGAQHQCLANIIHSSLYNVPPDGTTSASQTRCYYTLFLATGTTVYFVICTYLMIPESRYTCTFCTYPAVNMQLLRIPRGIPAPFTHTAGYAAVVYCQHPCYQAKIAHIPWYGLCMGTGIWVSIYSY